MRNVIVMLSLISGFGVLGSHAAGKEIAVLPGQSIQAAMDTLKADGGVITLKTGVHKVDRSVVFNSNITLQGDPSAKLGDVCIVAQGTGMRTAILMNQKPISNVIIRNLSIRGSLKPEEKRYPPETHKNPVAGMRKGHLGILFTAGGDSYESAENRNITIENVEVTNCSMGIHLKGSRDVILTKLKLHDNGMVEKYFHNIYLRRVFKVCIKDSVFYDSPTGCGVNISQSGDVTIKNSVAKNNFWRGMRIYGEHGWIVKKILVTGNKCLNNGDVGFLLVNIKGGTVSGNLAQKNKAGNMKSGNTKGVKFTDNKF